MMFCQLSRDLPSDFVTLLWEPVTCAPHRKPGNTCKTMHNSRTTQQNSIKFCVDLIASFFQYVCKKSMEFKHKLNLYWHSQNVEIITTWQKTKLVIDTAAMICRAVHAVSSHGLYQYPQLSLGYGLPLHLQQGKQLLQRQRWWVVFENTAL